MRVCSLGQRNANESDRGERVVSGTIDTIPKERGYKSVYKMGDSKRDKGGKARKYNFRGKGQELNV